MTIGFDERVEFLSDGWIAAARTHLETRMAMAGPHLDGVHFAMCESFENAPSHLKRPGNIASWHACLAGQDIKVGAGAIDNANFQIRGDYNSVLPVARGVYGTDKQSAARIQRENIKRLRGPTAEVSGQPAEGAAAFVFADLHDFLARRTIDNPDLAGRIAAQGLSRHAKELDEQGYTILDGAFSSRFAAELRETILDRLAENDHPQAPAAMLLERGRIFEEAAQHPWLMTLAEKLCGKGFLLAQLLGQRKGTGPGVLGLHSDYNLIREPFPEHPQACTAIWALEDFTIEAGPTTIVPASHRRRRHPTVRDDPRELVPIVMSKGSIAIWDGACWHAQGDRSLDGERITLHSTYSRMTLRTYDCYLNIAEEILDRNPPDLATLCGLDDLFEKNTYAGPNFAKLRRSQAIFRS